MLVDLVRNIWNSNVDFNVTFHSLSHNFTNSTLSGFDIIRNR